ncbi:MAG TPA: rhamnulokinase family protein [Streptosporangiaceae bacterium]|nr:rhamnulokinase family protein [Streptosporangiaceae bacterium]
MSVFAAVDLGASGGRVIAGRADGARLELRQVHRFPNEPVLAGATLYWDILRLYGNVRHGLRLAAESFELAGVGIDSWGVDYGLLDAAGALIGNPVHYRDARTDGVLSGVPFAELYSVTGIQYLPFNTIYQLIAAAGSPALAAARTLLLIPDLLGYWLTGSAGAELTNASTTALLDVRARSWATGIIERAGIPTGLFPPLRQPGDVIGPVGVLRDVPLIAVGSHDTASAVAAVPADGPHFAYVSSGTWSLAGLELAAPVLTEASRAANFTNEAGIDGTIRYLRNVTGLWLVQECLRCWDAPPLEPLLAAAARLEPLRFVVDADDPVFLPPGDMPGRIVSWLASRGLPVPAGPAEIVRCILDSLALAYRRALLAAQELSGQHADVVHIVGGGARNALLCQLTADALGLPVVAGPAEATALGNVLVQARALGAAPGTLGELRAFTRASGIELTRYAPSGNAPQWSAAATRVRTP